MAEAGLKLEAVATGQLVVGLGYPADRWMQLMHQVINLRNNMRNGTREERLAGHSAASQLAAAIRSERWAERLAEELRATNVGLRRLAERNAHLEKEIERTIAESKKPSSGSMLTLETVEANYDRQVTQTKVLAEENEVLKKYRDELTEELRLAKDAMSPMNALAMDRLENLTKSYEQKTEALDQMQKEYGMLEAHATEVEQQNVELIKECNRLTELGNLMAAKPVVVFGTIVSYGLKNIADAIASRVK